MNIWIWLEVVELVGLNHAKCDISKHSHHVKVLDLRELAQAQAGRIPSLVLKSQAQQGLLSPPMGPSPFFWLCNELYHF